MGNVERFGGQVPRMQGSSEDRRERIRRMRDRGPQKLTRQVGRMGDEDPAGSTSEPSTAATELTVEHEHGLHLRPAADFVRLAAKYQSVVKVANLTRGGDREASARSLLEVTALGVNEGHTIRLRATGDDAEAAVQALADLIRSNFGTGGNA